MIHALPFSFSNFRSIIDEISFPFSKKTTVLVGPNNSGKSNILRFIALFFNGAASHISALYDFPSSDKTIHVTISLTKDLFALLFQQYRSVTNYIEHWDGVSLPLRLAMSNSGIEIVGFDKKELFNVIPQHYFATHIFSQDFRSSREEQDNIDTFQRVIDLKELQFGTVFVPNQRFLTIPNQEPPFFDKLSFPGKTIAFGEAVQRLAEMDRPSFENLASQDTLRKICDFMEYTLEVKSVGIEVPNDKKSIIITIDGETRPISNLGTGVEQLLMIGLASIGFPDKIVLIDEPELHLHPRSQKRVMKYLDANVQALFVVATHSAAVIDAIDADVIQIVHTAGKTLGRTIRSNMDRFRAIRDLGHSPSELVQTRFAIWVEGPSDRIYVNHWISKADPDLIEGVDYSILFYGGKILSHHSFEDIEADLVKCLSFSRSFAIVMDSDRAKASARLNASKQRIRAEVESQGGFCWITSGREIENYLSPDLINKLSKQFRGVKMPKNKYTKILDSLKANKVEFARVAIGHDGTDWPLDLKQNTNRLVELIRSAN